MLFLRLCSLLLSKTGFFFDRWFRVFVNFSYCPLPSAFTRSLWLLKDVLKFWFWIGTRIACAYFEIYWACRAEPGFQSWCFMLCGFSTNQISWYLKPARCSYSVLKHILIMNLSIPAKMGSIEILFCGISKPVSVQSGSAGLIEYLLECLGSTCK